MYIVLDFEFNQAFNFEDQTVSVNPACRFEIIQIGAVKLDNKFNEIGSFSTYIKPQIYKRLHPYVGKMTGITNENLQNAPFFPEAYAKFREFIGDSMVYCVWGNSDIRALYRNLSFYDIIHGDIMLEYIDLQQLVTKKLRYGNGRTIGLKNAVEMMEIDIDYPFHNALSDAIYTAKVFKKIRPDKNAIRIFNSKHIPKRSKAVKIKR